MHACQPLLLWRRCWGAVVVVFTFQVGNGLSIIRKRNLSPSCWITTCINWWRRRSFFQHLQYAFHNNSTYHCLLAHIACFFGSSSANTRASTYWITYSLVPSHVSAPRWCIHKCDLWRQCSWTYGWDWRWHSPSKVYNDLWHWKLGYVGTR